MTFKSKKKSNGLLEYDIFHNCCNQVNDCEYGMTNHRKSYLSVISALEK